MTAPGGSLVFRSSLYPLALLRMAVAAVVLISPEPSIAQTIAERPSSLWFAPVGMGFFIPVLEVIRPALPLIHKALQASALLSLFGLWTRSSLWVLAASFYVLFGTVQLSGSVLHNMHLLWMLLLLALSPCSAVWSLDAWSEARRASPGAEREAGHALVVARIFLGLIYFFPGLHKLLSQGLGWASNENLRNQLYQKWFQAGQVVPGWRIDLVPGWAAPQFCSLSSVSSRSFCPNGVA